MPSQTDESKEINELLTKYVYGMADKIVASMNIRPTVAASSVIVKETQKVITVSNTVGNHKDDGSSHGADSITADTLYLKCKLY